MKKYIILIVLTVLMTACGKSAIAPASGYGNTVSSFSATDEDGKTFTNKDLKGKVWIADFMFTNCKTVCPPMTYNMSTVVDELEKQHVKNYGIISFSVDPKRDKPEVMKNYVAKYGSAMKHWKLLTNYDEKFIRQFGEESFKTIVVPPSKNNDQATHGTSFYLIDQNGTVIKDYIGKDTGDQKFPKDQIVKDVKVMSDKGPYKK
ncbi:SCO family protein [Macrococcus equipercicus]|uniref:SCO family protein n=1 Tax=Macrococcus equipercicus TaxID=69967 RepID=A0A9Q9F0E5_9STAP|nr:SCO family protein [Macrococcus equipercicus]KAA1040295.1 SCO family protein [Macrococcus equipercicus]UTH12762.1 SCO family protein [Macrococcus equipercicus]